jgi:hypothetical protein
MGEGQDETPKRRVSSQDGREEEEGMQGNEKANHQNKPQRCSNYLPLRDMRKRLKYNALQVGGGIEKTAGCGLANAEGPHTGNANTQNDNHYATSYIMLCYIMLYRLLHHATSYIMLHRLHTTLAEKGLTAASRLSPAREADWTGASNPQDS